MCKAVLPVVVGRISNSLQEELAVLLHRVEGVLHCVIDGLLYGVTHLFDLIHTSTGLKILRQTNKILRKI